MCRSMLMPTTGRRAGPRRGRARPRTGPTTAPSSNPEGGGGDAAPAVHLRRIRMPSVINNKRLLFSESVMGLAFQLIPAAICAIPLGARGGASLYSGAPRTDGFTPPAAAVERSHKGSLLVRPFGRGGAEIP